MATFYATYSASEATGSTVTANQGTSPWVVAGNGTAGTSATGVLSVQGIAGGTAVPISGSITATNPSVGATGSAVPASTTYIGASVAGTMTGLVATAAGLKVDGSASTQPISGTVAATQSGTWTVQPGNTANTTAWKVDGSAVTQPVSGTVAVTQSTSPWVTSGTSTVSGTVAATQSGTWNITNVSGTVSLPTGAATEATLVTLPLAQASTTSGQSGVLVQGAVTTAAPSYTTAKTNPLSLTTAGALRVDASASTQPVSGTVAATQSGTWTVQPGNTANSTPWLTTVSTALPAGSAIIGNVRVDQTTPGTTNGVVVNTIAPVTTTTAVFQSEGAVAFGSITNLYATLFTPTAATKILQMRNNTNAAISVSMDAGSTTNYTLDQGDAISLDLLANALSMGATAIQVKYAVGAPTSGSFRINGVH